MPVPWETFLNTAIDKVRASLRRALAQATFEIDHSTIVDLEQLRELHARAKRDHKGSAAELDPRSFAFRDHGKRK